MAKFYQVGGSVRDEILGKKSKDIDFTVVAKSYNAMRNAIIKRGGTIYLETPQYFTIRANVPKLGACDYVLARKEGNYKDGRHPESVEIGSLRDDLSRRDFTMNAIAKDEDGTYIDPFNGIADIKANLIRCVGNTEDRFREDGLRILRALRFSVVKHMNLDVEIVNFLIFEKVESFLNGVSTERIREELLKMFHASTTTSIQLLVQHNLLWLFDEHKMWLKPTTEK